ncbi:response regulator transcription factor [Plantactinospora sp. KLBMP9567]|uniref:response regulator transcription factor n=1 Tax=Plantactinospora sp. KLBMP9567 TaxID=3085900 RepID=UPI0029820B28|nr:response regulator transcription factor [Plantactinospora sp. KLBMP9567]MDW5327028.1 response regulator transcription factor [Plantactinospora sp. KLBMP9567]
MRIVIAEDAALMRDGLTTLLGALGHEIVHAAKDAEQLRSVVDALETDPPEVIITDVRMPPTHTDEGLLAALAIRERHPTVAILVLSQYLGGEYASRLLTRAETQPGGVGYLLKDRIGHLTELDRAIHTVAAGGVVVDPKVIDDLVMRNRRPLDQLTPRERDVLTLVARGRTNQQISEDLHLSMGAIEKNIRNVFDKLSITPADGNRRVLATLTWLSFRNSQS